MTIEEIFKQYNIHDDGVPFFTNPFFTDAIVGYEPNGGLIYNYNKMIECAMEEEGWSYEDAVAWIDTNTLRTIPYMGDKHPIIVYDDEE